MKTRFFPDPRNLHPSVLLKTLILALILALIPSGCGDNTSPAPSINDSANEPGFDLVNAGTVDLSVSVGVDPAFSAAGVEVVVTYTVENAGPEVATGAVLDMMWPAGVGGAIDGDGTCQYVSASEGWHYACALGDLDNGATTTTTLTLTPTESGDYLFEGQVTTTAEDRDASNNEASATLLVDPSEADLRTEKRQVEDEVLVGGIADFRLLIYNDGPGVAPNITLEDEVPAGFVVVSASPSASSIYCGTSGDEHYCSGGGGVCRFTEGSNRVTCEWSEVLESGDVTGARIRARAEESGIFTNTFSIASESIIDTNPDNDDASVEVEVLATADLAVTAQAPGNPLLNDEFDFQYEVTNGGPDAAEDVVVTVEALPSTVDLVSTTGLTCTGTGPYTCSVGAMTSGETVSGTFTLQAATEGLAPITVSVASATADPEPANNSATRTPQISVDPLPEGADLSVLVEVVPTSVEAGTEVVVTYTVSNAGPEVATGAVLDMMWPSGVGGSIDGDGTCEYVSASGGWHYACSLGDLDNGGTTTTTLTLTPTDPGDYLFEGQVTTTAEDRDATNDEASATLEVTPAVADLRTEKRQLEDDLLVGGIADFRLLVYNDGPGVAPNITLEDELPTGFVVVSASPSASSIYCGTSGDEHYCSGGGGVCRYTEGSNRVTCEWSEVLESGGVTGARIRARAEESGTFTNTFSVASESISDPNPDNDAASVEVEILATADLDLTAQMPGAPVLSTEFDFDYEVTNGGPDDAVDAFVTIEALPSTVEFVSTSGITCTGTGPFNCPLGTLASGETAAGTLTLLAKSAGEAQIAASVASSTVDPNLDNNALTRTATIDANLPPVADAGGPYEGIAGEPMTFDGSASEDPDGDIAEYEWDFGDGSDPVTTTEPTVEHTYADAGTFTVILTVTDDVGATDSDETTAEILARPVADANGPYTVDEGSEVVLDGSGSSDADGTIESYEWTIEGVADPIVTAEATLAHTFDASGTYAVQLVVTDDDGLESEPSETTVEVLNVAPTGTFTNDGPVDEGQDFHLSIIDPYDPSEADVAAGFEYAFDCGDGSGYGDWGTPAEATCPTTDNETRSVGGKIRDQDGGETEYTAEVEIFNVAPTVGPISGPMAPVAVGVEIVMSAEFTDPGTDDTHTATWDWGESTTDGDVDETDGSGTVEGRYAYTAPGIYTVVLTVTDDDGGSGQAVFQDLVVYDPSLFVTGGGWIPSTDGSNGKGKSEAKANVGFNAKYQDGAEVPSGNVQFQDRSADVKFHASQFDWLIIDQENGTALFTGTGALDGEGEYRFELAATDGEPDTFRIKIWTGDEGNETIIYDSGAEQALEGGSVQVHER